jgi:hypothetical protein
MPPDTYLALLDDFNRADVGPPPSASWSTLGSNGLKVVSNQCAGNSPSTNAGYWSAATFGPNYGVAADWPVISALVEVRLRLTTPGLGTTNGYSFQYSAGTFSLLRIDAGSNTTLTSVSGSLTTGDAIAIQAIGSVLTGYQKTGGVWSELLTTTDATYSTAGYIGLAIGGAASRCDNFSGGIPPPSPTTSVSVPLVTERSYV